MFEIEELEEIKCIRAVLERILRVMDEGLFLDYQLEKWGRIKKGTPKEVEWKADISQIIQIGEALKKMKEKE